MPSLAADQRQTMSTHSPLVGEGQQPDKMQGHWVLARVGKRVLRPGGLGLTRRMLDALAIRPDDRVVEFAPGLGVTARLVLNLHPASYRGVEREPAAAKFLQHKLAREGVEILLGRAEDSGLPTARASVVYSEALLSMQAPQQKSAIVAEAQRVLAAGGRYAIHELCLLPDDIPDAVRDRIRADMSREIHVGVQPLSVKEWVTLLEQNGFKVVWKGTASMQLLEPSRLVSDEGLRGALRIAFNVARNPVLRQRVCAMRRLFRRYEDHLGAISLVAERAAAIPDPV